MQSPDGTLKLEHLHFLKETVPFLEAEEKGLFKLAASIPRDVFNLLLEEDFSWAEYYELTPKQHFIIFFWALGLFGIIERLTAQLGNVNQAIIELATRFENYEDEVIQGWFQGGEIPSSLEDAKNLKGGPGGAIRAQDIGGLLYSIWFQGYALRKHGKYMSDLLDDVRQGKDESFWLAVKIDPTVVTCSTFARRMSIAFMRNEVDFFTSLSKALKPKERESKELDPLRVLLQACLESKWLDVMSMDEADRLFIQELEAYSNEGEDPVGGLQRFINRWKNNK